MTDRQFRIACVQVTADEDVAANVSRATDLIRAAHGQGAQLIALPEAVNFIAKGRERALELAEPADDNRALKGFQATASELGCWVLAGSILMRVGPDTLVNRSHLIDPGGQVVATYDKIHMFDVDLANGERHRESATYTPGGRAVVVDTPFARLGLSVCYDVRFPYLYRALAHAGAQVLTVPAAFTRFTGQAHWHVLLRARAIETACFVIAPAQCGRHSPDRETYGHSLIIDPWGEVLAEGGAEPGVTVADIDLSAIERARRMVPAIHHDRPFEAPAPVLDRPALRAAE
ncbi:MAG: carbon-nitrogen hydrolase family protein [Alphaproteobacteria bacterium]|nr:carbon-nitrogen hydrolase family protein [Alphaproteobacteria bacterium]